MNFVNFQNEFCEFSKWILWIFKMNFVNFQNECYEFSKWFLLIFKLNFVNFWIYFFLKKKYLIIFTHCKECRVHFVCTPCKFDINCFTTHIEQQERAILYHRTPNLHLLFYIFFGKPLSKVNRAWIGVFLSRIIEYRLLFIKALSDNVENTLRAKRTLYTHNFALIFRSGVPLWITSSVTK